MQQPPTIDIAALRQHPDDAAAWGECAAAIDAACTEIGFFVVTGHGLGAALDDVFAAAHSLFALDEPVKESLAMVDRRGFVPARHRVLDPSLHAAPMEYYDAGMGGPNRWPDPGRLPAFAPAVATYQSAALAVAADLLRAIAVALDLDPGFFAHRMLEPQCFLRMMHYEPRPPGDDGAPVVLTDPHTDYGLITLLATDGVSGLEVRPHHGGWTMVSAPEGSLVVNLGDMLARWSNDRYVSTPHRVAAPPARDRYSVPFFVNPDPATEIACLPSCVTARRPCRYPPVTAGAFLARRIADGGYMSDAARER